MYIGRNVSSQQRSYVINTDGKFKDGSQMLHTFQYQKVATCICKPALVGSLNTVEHCFVIHFPLS